MNKETLVDKREEFNLSEHILEDEIDQKTGFKYDGMDIEWVKEFIKKGDKIFCEDYGNHNITTEEYDYAQKKWEKFKKLAGENLLK